MSWVPTDRVSRDEFCGNERVLVEAMSKNPSMVLLGEFQGLVGD